MIERVTGTQYLESKGQLLKSDWLIKRETGLKKVTAAKRLA